METGFFGDDEVFEDAKSQEMIYEQHKVFIKKHEI